MALIFRWICSFIFLTGLQVAIATTNDGDISEVINELRQRIEALEDRDAAKNAIIAKMESEISDLKSKMGEMESMYKKKESTFQDKIDTLEKAMTYLTEDVKAQQSGIADNDLRRRRSSTPGRIQRQDATFRKDRAISETEIAFYATHEVSRIHHLGNNQTFQFQQALTNNGNAYNNNTGAFVAPVDGTYVFHGTVMAIDTTDHLRAHFDVDGTPLSVFYVSDHDQSSQMLVINLKVGQTVTIRNDYSDTGYIGQHHSTFSGFLLYQDYSSGVIVG